MILLPWSPGLPSGVRARRGQLRECAASKPSQELEAGIRKAPAPRPPRRRSTPTSCPSWPSARLPRAPGPAGAQSSPEKFLFDRPPPSSGRPGRSERRPTASSKRPSGAPGAGPRRRPLGTRAGRPLAAIAVAAGPPCGRHGLCRRGPGGRWEGRGRQARLEVEPNFAVGAQGGRRRLCAGHSLRRSLRRWRPRPRPQCAPSVAAARPRAPANNRLP